MKTWFSQIHKDVENTVFLCLVTVMPQGEKHTTDYPEMARNMYPSGQEGLYQHTAPANGLVFLKETPCSFQPRLIDLLPLLRTCLCRDRKNVSTEKQTRRINTRQQIFAASRIKSQALMVVFKCFHTMAGYHRQNCLQTSVLFTLY